MVGSWGLDSSGSGWWCVLMKTVMNLRAPYKAGNFLTIRVTVSLSRRTLLRLLSEL
jgi:hypothetical protein